MKLATFMKRNKLSLADVALILKAVSRGKLTPSRSTILKHKRGDWMPGAAYAKAYAKVSRDIRF